MRIRGTLRVFILTAVALIVRSEAANAPTIPFADSFETAGDLDLQTSTARHSPDKQAVLMSFRRRFYSFSIAFTASSLSDTFNTRELAAADFDGDGDIDVVAGNYGQPTRLYLNNGTEAPFDGVSGSNLTLDAYSTLAVAAADIDGDGDFDVITGNNNQRNRLYLNNGTAQPFLGVVGMDLTADAHSTQDLVLADLDGDGDIDVIAGNYSQANRVYLNNGTGDPFNGVTGLDLTADVNNTRGLAVADFDRDGDLDVVAANFSQTNRIYLNNGTANPFNGVTGSDLTTDAHGTTSIAAADFDGDGDIDVVAGNFDATSRLYLNTGGADPFGGIAGVGLNGGAQGTNAIQAADVDGDGNIDVIVGNEGQANRIYLNNGTGTPFVGVNPVDLTADAHLTDALAIADFNRDGFGDILVGNPSQANRLYLVSIVRTPLSFTVRNVGTQGPQSGSTYDAALADFDADGDLDVLLANSAMSNNGLPRLFLNNGTADPFTGVTGRDLEDSQGQFARAVVAADFDRDGDIDVAVGSRGYFSRVFFNNGTTEPFVGSYRTNVGVTWLNQVGAMAAADFNGDGAIDLLLGNENLPLQLYRNIGTGDPFPEGAKTEFGIAGVTSLTVADFDGDGDVDIVAGRFNDYNILYLNNGMWNPFFNAVGIELLNLGDSWTAALLSADFNGDGKIDLVEANDTQPIRVLMNNGGANPLSGAPVLLSNSNWAASLKAADFDGDGALDLVLGTANTAIRVYLNNRTNNPFDGVLPLEIPRSEITITVLAGDLNGDGLNDIVATNNDMTKVYLNNSTRDPWGALTSGDLGPETGRTIGLAVGDFDKDGDLDLAVGNFDNEANRLYLNNGSHAPFLGVNGSTISSDTRSTGAIAAADFDRDGDLDLVAGDSGTNRVYFNNGTGAPFSGVAGLDLSADADPTRALAVADLDNNGDIDVIAGNYPNRVNRFYLNNHPYTPFSGVSGRNLTDDAHSTLALAVGDLDRDGDIDVVAGNYSSQRNRVYLNDGSANFTGFDLTTDAHSTGALAIVDIDGDGDLDIIAGNDGQVSRVYLNDGAASFTGSNLSADVHTTRSLIVADVDRDGDIDVIIGNNGQSLRLYLNNGTSNPFSGVVGVDLSTDANVTLGLAIADFDRDGMLDVVAANYGQRNRLYQKLRYRTGAQFVVSRSEPAQSVPWQAGAPVFFAADEETPPGTDVDYYLSTNGGGRWRKVRSGESAANLAVGTELRWRAELRSQSPSISPVLNSVAIRYLPQVTAPVVLDLEGRDGLSAAEVADGTHVTVPLDSRFAVAGDAVSVSWGSQTETATISAVDVISSGIRVFIPSAKLLAAGEGIISVTATITDVFLNTSGPSPTVTALADYTAPLAPASPVFALEVTDGVLNEYEALDGTYVSVGLNGTGAVVGDTVAVVWDGAAVSRTLTAGDISAKQAVVLVSVSVIGIVRLKTVSVYAYLVDAVGNKSGNSASVNATVSTDGGDQDGDGLRDSAEVIAGTNPADPDSDDDGLSDGAEVTLGANPLSNDTDGDSLLDGWEVANGTNILVNDAAADPDGDGRTNLQEQAAGTDPQDADTDGDGMPDGYEALHGFNPLVSDGAGDADGDGLTNLFEYTNDSNPKSNDTDGDGLLDGWEVANGTNILVNDAAADPDGDGRTNLQEQAVGTDPLDADTDDDGMPDGFEALHGFNPLAPDGAGDADGDGLANIVEYRSGSNPKSSDTDGDGLLDGWEVVNGTNILVNDAAADPDGDGLTNSQEQAAGTNPKAADTDGDGMPDGYEIVQGFNPIVRDGVGDADGDGLTNLYEYVHGSDPKTNDTDGDGLPDGWEAANGTNILVNDAAGDLDGDGLTNLSEYLYGSDPRSTDSDGDGLLDGWEIANGTNIVMADDLADPDGDRLTNEAEKFFGTNPLVADTDGDGLSDGYEVARALNPLVADSDTDADADGLTNLEEFLLGTSPVVADTDGDGFSDGYEVRVGTDPLTITVVPVAADDDDRPVNPRDDIDDLPGEMPRPEPSGGDRSKPKRDVDEGGCNTGGSGNVESVLLLSAVWVIAQMRRRREPVAAR